MALRLEATTTVVDDGCVARCHGHGWEVSLFLAPLLWEPQTMGVLIFFIFIVLIFIMS